MPDDPEPSPQPQPDEPAPQPQRTTLQTAGPTLVLGATGSFGGAVAQELISRGEPVRLFVRDITRARDRFGTADRVEYVEGDALNGAALARAADGCSVIVHGVNYPYDQWDPAMRIATQNVIGAAAAHQATILFPGNVYALGRQTDRPLMEDAAHQPTTRKGTFRAELEGMLRAAADEQPCRVIILRAGDYFGSTVRNGLVDPIFGHAARGKTIRAIGNLSAAHQWAYVPDLARAGVDLLAIGDELDPFEVVHFGGYVAQAHERFLRDVAAAAGHPKLKITRAAWPLLTVIATFNRTVRELLELRYLFDEAVILSDEKLRRVLPAFEYTPIRRAIQSTVESYRAAPHT